MPALRTALFALSVVLPMVCDAQTITRRSSTRGLLLGVGVDGSSLRVNSRVIGGDTRTSEVGGGGSLIVGYGTDPSWAAFGRFSTAAISGDHGGVYGLTQVDVGMRLHYREGLNAVVPFWDAALTFWSAWDGVDSGRGIAGTLGGGLNTYFTPSFAVSGSALITLGKFDSFKVNSRRDTYGEAKSIGTRLQLGVIWFSG